MVLKVPFHKYQSLHSLETSFLFQLPHPRPRQAFLHKYSIVLLPCLFLFENMWNAKRGDLPANNLQEEYHNDPGYPQGLVGGRNKSDCNFYTFLLKRKYLLFARVLTLAKCSIFVQAVYD